MAKRGSSEFIRIRTDPSLGLLARVYRVSRLKRVSEGVGTGARAVARHIKRETPRRTGRLQRSQRLKRKSLLKWEFTEGEKYGLFLRRGVPASKINPILPVRKKALWWPGAAHPVMAVRNHPGIKKNPYWERGLKNAKGDLRKAGEQAGENIVTDIIDLKRG